MNYKLYLSAVLTVLVTSGIFVKNNRAEALRNPAGISGNGHIVKAILHDGEVLPHVDLPEVVITGNRHTEFLVTAEIIDGEVHPSILLDEVVITPNS